MTENPATLIESGFASRASTHKSKTSRKIRKSSTAARYTLSANSRCEQMRANRLVPACNLQVPRKQLQFSECNTGLQNTTGSYFSSQNATQRCKTRQSRRGPISGPLSGPSGSPRSPAEPHPPSLAWVETLVRVSGLCQPYVSHCLIARRM